MRQIDADALKNMRFSCDMHDDNYIVYVPMREVNENIDKAPTIGGWISVEERLPSKGQIVIASDGEHTWDVVMYKSFCGKPSEWNWKKNTLKTVLWWMPKDGALPEPPKE